MTEKRQKPRKFSPSSAKLRRQIQAEFQFNSAEQAILDVGLEARDLALAAMEEIRRDGLTISSTGGMIRKHPAIEILKIGRAQYLQAFKQLGLREDEEVRVPRIGRPPGT